MERLNIDNFTFGKVTIGGTEYHSDVVILPPRVMAEWWRKEGHVLHTEDLAEVLAYRPEVLIVGTGASGQMHVPDATVGDMESAAVRMEVLPTGEACSRFNELAAAGVRVAAAFHLTC